MGLHCRRESCASETCQGYASRIDFLVMAKDDAKIALHREVLKEVRAEKTEWESRKSEAEEKIAELSAVETFHINKLKGLGDTSNLVGDLSENRSEGEMQARRNGAYGGMTKHAACEKVLRLNEAPMKTADIDHVLIRADYGTHLSDPNIRYAGLYATMYRHPEIFVNLGNGVWALREWGLEAEENS